MLRGRARCCSLVARRHVSLSVELAPYRASAGYLHDYYSVSTNLLKVLHKETFIQLEPDFDTERFLAFSQSEMRKFRYKFILSKFINNKEITKSYSKWNVADSFLMSNQQFRHFLRASGVDLAEGEKFKVFEIGQGSGTILKTLGKGLGTEELYGYDTDAWANFRAKKRGIKIERAEWTAIDGEKMSSEHHKYDITCLFNVLDRTGSPVTLLEDAVSVTKPNGVILISVSTPWRPSPTCKYKVVGGDAIIKSKGGTKGSYSENAYSSDLQKKWIQRREKLVDIPQTNIKRGYPWWRPLDIPTTFEAAANDILMGIASGGKRYQFVSQMKGWLHYIPKVGQSHTTQLEILGWTRTPYWLVGLPVECAMDNITIAVRKSDIRENFAGFDEPDAPDFMRHLYND